MEKLRSLAFIMSFVFIAFCGINCYSQNDKLKYDPGLEEKYIWDFGKVQQGDIVKHVFVFKNETERTLKILKIDTSCGCTASQAAKDELSPGEEN